MKTNRQDKKTIVKTNLIYKLISKLSSKKSKISIADKPRKEKVSISISIVNKLNIINSVILTSFFFLR